MADTVIVGDEGGAAAPSSAEQSAHEAAVAEGATAVQAMSAAESAAEAKAAAEVALAAAEANIAGGAVVEEAAAEAAQSAAQAGVSLEMLHEALQAQGAAIEALTAEMHASRKQSAGPEKSRPAPPDQEPGSGGPKWVRR